jgi:hypothetical protein
MIVANEVQGTVHDQMRPVGAQAFALHTSLTAQEPRADDQIPERLPSACV